MRTEKTITAVVLLQCVAFITRLLVLVSQACLEMDLSFSTEWFDLVYYASTELLPFVLLVLLVNGVFDISGKKRRQIVRDERLLFRQRFGEDPLRALYIFAFSHIYSSSS